MNGRLASLFVDSRCTLGEGICWSSRREALLWTDIEGRALWHHSLGNGHTMNWRLPDRVGAFVECESGSLLLGFAKCLRLAQFTEDFSAPVFTDLVQVEAVSPTTRINDGRTDRTGNFVFGTLNEDVGHAPLGSFYQFSISHGLRRLSLPSVVIPNSICFSPDGGTIYFCDSLDRAIQQADYDADHARVEHVRPFVEFGPLQGLPDGSIVDSAGCLWNATWGAGVVRQFAPDGELVCEIAVPPKNPTCAAFGGPDLSELYVTSSRQEMSTDELEREPHAGGVYRLSPVATGLPDCPFRNL